MVARCCGYLEDVQAEPHTRGHLSSGANVVAVSMQRLDLDPDKACGPDLSPNVPSSFDE